MLVDVVQLRREGVKLPRDAVRASEPMRGELEINNHGGVCRAILKSPEVETGGFGTPVPTLSDCRVRSMYGNDFVIVGFETIGPFHATRKVPQAWWARVVERQTPPMTTSGT